MGFRRYEPHVGPRTHLSSEDFLATLNPELAAQLRQADEARTRMPSPSRLVRRLKPWQGDRGRVASHHPRYTD